MSRRTKVKLWAVLVAVVVGAVLLWPVLKVLAQAAWAVVQAVWVAWPYVIAYEGLVGIVAVLDWRDGRLNVERRWQAWIVAHSTLWSRVWRRARWAAGCVQIAVAQRRKPASPPSAPAALRVVPAPAPAGEVQAA